MILQRITTTNFRNLAGDAVAFHPTVNLVVGRNGQGKTNLLEAIYFLATTKSFRTPRVATLFRFGEASVFAGGEVVRDGMVRHLSAGIDWSEGKRRALLVNEERVPLAAYVSALSVFAYSAARLEVIRGTPEERRRFLDRGIASLDATYLDKLTRYVRVLRQRNALLQRIAAGAAGAASLDSWNEEFVTTATVVSAARRLYLEQLQEAFGNVVREHRYHLPPMTMTYRGSSEEAELREMLRRLRSDELRARGSLIGPQRDNVEFVMDGRPVSEVLSGGETKMVVLFLKMAKIALFRRRFDEPPLFLFDDLDAELDLDILHRLLLSLPTKTQVFATSAKEPYLAALATGSHRRLTIENGRVTSSIDFG